MDVIASQPCCDVRFRAQRHPKEGSGARRQSPQRVRPGQWGHGESIDERIELRSVHSASVLLRGCPILAVARGDAAIRSSVHAGMGSTGSSSRTRPPRMLPAAWPWTT